MTASAHTTSRRGAIARTLAADLLALAALFGLLAGVGAVVGFGPLAGGVPPDRVTDPREMLARSIQATLEASSVHIEGTVQGQVPGPLVQRPDALVPLIGTLSADLRPRDARTRAHVVVHALDIDADTVTVFTTAWYRTAGGAWQQMPVSDAASGTGLDLNPLTLVDRVRSYLASRNQPPVLVDVACASASGRCHRVTLDAGADPAASLAAVLPGATTATLPPTSTTITLDTDVLTLRPAALEIVALSTDGTVALRLHLDFSAWDGPSVIDAPSG